MTTGFDIKEVIGDLDNSDLNRWWWWKKIR